MRAAFQERDRCVHCQGYELEVVWQGRFNDEAVRRWIKASRYSGPVEEALGDEAFARVACRACGMTFHRRVLANEWLSTLYGEWIDSAQVEAFEAAHWHGRPDRFFSQTVQLVKHLLRLRHLAGSTTKALRLLDFGCGDGKFIGLAAAFGFSAFGIDFSVSRRERAHGAGITVCPSLAELDSLGGGPFDCVTLFEVLEHVADPRTVLHELAARMKPGGILLIEVPDCRGIGVPKSFEEFAAVQPLEHINHFTPEMLVRFCQSAGFASVRRVPAHVTTSVAALLRTEASRWVTPASTSRYFRRR